MKRYLPIFILAFFAVVAISASVSYAGSIADEYQRQADELRVRAETETDVAKRDAMLVQADELEQMAEEHSIPEPESIFEDTEDADAASAQRSREQLDKMRRDYERGLRNQDKTDAEVNRRICPSCEE